MAKTHITGYQLAQKIKELGDRRDIRQQQFNQCFQVFPSQKAHAPDPKQLTAALIELEGKLALLQVAQSEYNLIVAVQVGETTVPLAQAIKTVGGLGRASKAWKTAAKGTQNRNPYATYRPTARNLNPDTEELTDYYSADEALEQHLFLEGQIGVLRAAIQQGNSQVVELELPEGLL
jgi:hypothetical protein